jgi:hypothetical protein
MPDKFKLVQKEHPIEMFISYSHKDAKLASSLENRHDPQAGIMPKG